MSSFRPHPVDWTDEKVARFWDDLAARDASEFFSEKSATDIAGRLLRFRPRAVADIGCGTGPLVAELARRGIDAIGVDSSAGVLEAAARRAPGATFHVGSVTNLPLADASVDGATLIEVVEHLDDETLDSAIREAHRILRVGGVLLITTPNAENVAAATRQCPDCGAEFHIYQHVRRWTADTLGEYVAARGFAVRSVRPTAFDERGPVWANLGRRVYYSLSRRWPRLLLLATRRGPESQR